MIYIFSKYGLLGASSRIRTYQYILGSDLHNDKTIFNELISDDQLKRKYNNKHYDVFQLLISFALRAKLLMKSTPEDIIYIEKELFPWVPAFLEKYFLRNRCYLLNYDDAIFHNYDDNKHWVIRVMYGSKIESLIFCSNGHFLLSSMILESVIFLH